MSHIRPWPHDRRGPSTRPWKSERHAAEDGYWIDDDGLAGLQRRRRGLIASRTSTPPAKFRKHRKR
jgi:hypothetical protein